MISLRKEELMTHIARDRRLDLFLSWFTFPNLVQIVLTTEKTALIKSRLFLSKEGMHHRTFTSVRGYLIIESRVKKCLSPSELLNLYVFEITSESSSNYSTVCSFTFTSIPKFCELNQRYLKYGSISIRSVYFGGDRGVLW